MPTLEQIQAKLKKLQAQADVLLARKAQAAVDQIRELMLKHGLTTEDIEAKAKAKRAARGLNGHAASGKIKLASSGKPAKYRDHKTGATWTGHGRAPGWIANVKDRTQFLIDGVSELKSAAKSIATQAKGTKGQPKGAQPPKYLNPKTGATWSGRGPAPAWLASVKDRTRFLIDGAVATVSDASKKAATKVAAKAGKAKAAATSGGVSKKAAAKKVVAKKAVASKKAAAKKVTAKKASAKSTAATRTVAAKKPAAKKAATRAARKSPGRPAAAKTPVASAAAEPQTSTAQASA